MKKTKYILLGVVAVLFVATGTAAFKADFKLGQNIELVVNMMRGLFAYYVDEVNPDTLGKNAAKGMVSGLDPYTELIHADDMAQFELLTTGKYGGIGSVIRQKGDHVVIAEPYKGSPAEKAGLQIGDEIVEIDGKSTKGMTTGDISSRLKGEAGTRVRVKVLKFYTGKTQTITLRREIITLPAVPYFGMVADSVGYIHHSEFTDGSAEELKGAFTQLKSLGAKRLILDYRGNGGGIMQEAIKIVSIFVPKGTAVVSMRGRGRGTDQVYRTATEPLDTLIPIAVLVDGYTASASEIVAGALQDLDRAVIIGQRTFGKGLVQSTLPLGYNSYLKVTTAKYYTPSGRCIQAIDYSHQTGDSESESQRRAVPDSLIKEFHTAAGRKVYDGGGIMPDVRIEPEKTDRFVYLIYSQGFTDDFADQWSLANPTREVSPQTFALTDGDWAKWAEFMKDKTVNYRSLTSQSLDALRKSAEMERYMTPELGGYLDKIAAAITNDTAANLTLYRGELSTLIEDAIILRRHHATGVSAHNLVGDKEVAKAVSVLNDAALYRRISTTANTEKR